MKLFLKCIQGEGAGENWGEQEGPYACKLCGKKFAKSAHLKRHMVTHTDKKPFVCRQVSLELKYYDLLCSGGFNESLPR